MTPYEVMRSWEGIREDDPAAVKPIAEAYGKPFDFDSDAWCAVAIIAAVQKAGQSAEGMSPAARDALKWAHAADRISNVNRLAEGDIVVFWRESPASWKGHVGFFVRREGDYLIVLGGNQKDAVREEPYPVDRFLGAVRPPVNGQSNMPNSFESMQAGYRNLWNQMHVTRVAQAEQVAQKLLKDKASYQAVQKATGVPWYWVACVHMRESSGDFGGILHNGERIIGTGQKTTKVPPGRGPFNSWHEAAADALAYKGLDKITEWTLERCLYEFERYNGFGYVDRGVNSPYVWAGTSLQQRGKYVSDRVFDATVWDEQLGCAAVLKALSDADAEVAQRLAVGTAPLPGNESAEETGTRPSLSQFTEYELMAELMKRPGISTSFHYKGD